MGTTEITAAVNPRARQCLIRRYYDPGTGQFLSVDPAVDQTQAPYAYVDGDPVNGIDPLGLGCFLGVACTFQSWGEHVVGQFAYNVAGTFGQLSTTWCEIKHDPGAFIGSVAGYTAGAAIFAGGGWVAAEIAGSESPGFLAEISHPAHVGIGAGGVVLPALVPFYFGYVGSEDLSKH
jgi:hypothetical protein